MWRVALAILITCEMAACAQQPALRISLPDNPCDVLPRTAIESATGLVVTDVRRAPSISKIVQAQASNAEPGPGTICVYETSTAFGAVNIALPLEADRTAAKYWENRNRYFRTYPGAARVISGLGEDAWLAGGADLHLLVHDDEFLIVSVQHYQPQAGDLLIAVAHRILDQFQRRP